MGVNCNVTLSQYATWKAVGQVACVLLGARVTKEQFGSGLKGWHAAVEGFGYGKFEATHTPDYIDILISGDVSNPVSKALQDGDSMPYRLWYGIERKSLYPKATAAKIALAEAITKFFGGKITYNDCTDESASFPIRRWIGDESNAAFERFQVELMELKPLGKQDIDRCAKYAAY